MAVLLTLFPCIFSASNTSDAPLTTYHTGTNEVRLAFFATDERDHLVESLGRDDFAVVDGESVVRDFRSLTRSSETALEIVVLVDTSQSVEKHFRSIVEDVSRLATAFPPNRADTLSVVAFSGVHSRILCAGNCADSAAQQRIRGLRADGNTPLYDAMIEVASNLAARPKPDVRQVVILFSDGIDTISRASAHEALKQFMATSAVVYAVSQDTSSENGRLDDIAEATGGRLLVRSGVNVLETILAEQRASYVVTYSLPRRDQGFHSLRILPKHNLNLQFHCRRGYYYDEVR